MARAVTLNCLMGKTQGDLGEGVLVQEPLLS